jgi:hypothetical protein
MSERARSILTGLGAGSLGNLLGTEAPEYPPPGPQLQPTRLPHEEVLWREWRAEHPDADAREAFLAGYGAGYDEAY